MAFPSGKFGVRLIGPRSPREEADPLKGSRVSVRNRPGASIYPRCVMPLVCVPEIVQLQAQSAIAAARYGRFHVKGMFPHRKHRRPTAFTRWPRDCPRVHRLGRVVAGRAVGRACGRPGPHQARAVAGRAVGRPCSRQAVQSESCAVRRPCSRQAVQLAGPTNHPGCRVGRSARTEACPLPRAGGYPPKRRRRRRISYSWTIAVA
jgi:hypothetical protein